MSAPLQLRDYLNGYRFQAQCRRCGYGWYERPRDLAALAEDAVFWFLDEVAAILVCRRCGANAPRLTPLRARAIHHFVGGLP